MAEYPNPGRGAWTLTGGLLPVRPDSKNKAGYYRAGAVGEMSPGQAYGSGKDRSHDPYMVWLGVREIQALLGVEVDGWYGRKTAAAAFRAQDRLDIAADGIVGRSTMKALLSPVVVDVAAHNGVPASILGGLCVNESALDPAAVGVNGVDHGVAQINLAAHPGTTIEEAMDLDYALMFAASDLQETHERWAGRTKGGVDPWDVAIANHNSPRLAQQWATAGHPPVVEGRVFQIETYVERVKAAW